MALWKVSINSSAKINSVRLRKGMSVQIANHGVNPVIASSYRDQIAQLFMNNFGIDLKKRTL
ncbi:MAG: DUF6140 family protein [Paludibacteraceae bacterium]|nr:DUF6140 family protein [Paludibacteraceae bacterium]